MSRELENLFSDCAKSNTRRVVLAHDAWKYDPAAWREHGFRSLPDAKLACDNGYVYTLTVFADNDTYITRASNIARLIYWTRVTRGEFIDGQRNQVHEDDHRLIVLQEHFKVTKETSRFILFLYDNPGPIAHDEFFINLWQGKRRDALLKQYTYRTRERCGADAVDTIPGFGIRITPRFHATVKEILEKRDV
jgi:DNA-binding winged helix-turn-helix (wHTH) protein